MDHQSSMRRIALYAASSALMIRAQQQFAEEHEFPFETHQVQEAVMGFVPWLRRLIRLLAIGSALMVSSMMLYGGFYLSVMPPHHAAEQLFFDYTCDDSTDMRRGENVTYSSRDSHYCVPAATVDLFAKHTPWKALQEEILPPLIAEERMLRPGQAYFIEIALRLPESDHNMRVGMFGVSVELHSSNGTALATSVRSTRLPHESRWIGVIRRLSCLLPLLIGAISESRAIIVPSYRHYVESSRHPLRHITVRLVPSRKIWRDDIPVEVISGEIWIGKELSPFQSTLKEWFYSCFLIGSMVMLLGQLLFLSIGRLWWDQRQRRSEEAQRVTDLDHDGEQAEEFVGHDAVDFEGMEFDDDGDWEEMPLRNVDTENTGRGDSGGACVFQNGHRHDPSLDTNDVAMDSETVSLVTANDDEPTSETDEARALAGDNPAERVAQGIFEALSTG